ncbi:hypothetical protein SH528x_002790 [Novipirellula sp. SH528]|uniref:hypothetical protein n=1 Tax=Novipirellula sp. SH528 TaxID=3454466 RepID=UPI003F9F3D8F
MSDNLSTDQIGEDRLADRALDDRPQDARSPPTTVADASLENLRDCINNAGTLAIADAITVVDQIASLLAVLHCNGITHGAIEPANIVLNDEGIPTLVGGECSASIQKINPDKETARPGDEGTMAAQAADVSVDLQGLGWTLYFLLTGRGPINSSDLAHLDAVDAELGVANPIFRQLISQDETQRYASVNELRFDLRKRGLVDLDSEVFDEVETLTNDLQRLPIAVQATEFCEPHQDDPLAVPQTGLGRSLPVAIGVAVVAVAAAAWYFWSN